MASTPISFIVKDVERSAELIIKKITLDIHANLVRAPGEGGTPVDTGWARANWVPAIGTRFEGTAGSRSAVSEGDAQAGIASVLAYKLAQGRVIISNNVPYIGGLNEGTSRQAPAAFVQAAIVKAVEVDARGV